MIKRELKLLVRYAGSAMDSPRVEINRLNIGLKKLHMTKNAAERIDDVAWIKIARCDLVQHRSKENEILAADQRHLYVGSAREPFVEVHCRIKPRKPTAGNDYSSRFHTITPNHNATRAIKILLMVVLIQSFPIFFSSFSATKF